MKKAFIVTLILTFLFISFLSYLSYESKLKMDSLEESIDQKEIKIDSLEEKIKDNERSILTLNNTISKQEDLLNEKDEIIAEQKYNIEEYESTYIKMSDYIEEISNELNKERVKKIPDNYYSERLYEYPNSARGLIEYLTYGFELPTSYKANVFDCSEASAYLEWCLEKHGFDSEIYIGKAPFDQTGYHAWVMVTTEDDYQVAIEATALTGGTEKWLERLTRVLDNKGRGVISYDENDEVTKRYYESNEDSFDSIYEAVEQRNLEEWNWWEGAWGLN